MVVQNDDKSNDNDATPVMSPRRGLTCPTCGSRRLAVIYTRPSTGNTLRRRRQCRACNRRFTTREMLLIETKGPHA